MGSAMRMPVMIAYMPVRGEAAHLCTESPAKFKMLDSAIKYMASRRSRVRIRTQYGQWEEGYQTSVRQFPCNPPFWSWS